MESDVLGLNSVVVIFVGILVAGALGLIAWLSSRKG